MNRSPRRALLRMTACTAALASASLLLTTPAMAAPTIGQPAPAFTALDSKGQQHKLADLKGKVVVLEWTNNECPYVKKHYGAANMQNLQKQATGAGVVWLSVISSAPGEQGHVTGAKADELTASRNAQPTAVLLDPQGEIGKAYDARTTPHMYVIDAKGILRYAGGIDSIATAKPADIEKADPYFKTALQSVLKGENVVQATTRPYGCAVKYKS
ncbi:MULTISPECIES: redoxin domain-containing protein [unclassified Massilia]|uniref:redoxin domain-containing protein n=1 Tax=unclassified Massilia TaxID=2609279 RepID=UPI00178043FE|nr:MULTISPECIES: redoxin domain-containing protein [unclassified Massilia]MBD8528920.1 redoxin domain-containing protein [Massilia sp. CFBP 13647]MBD8673562.1 redoxin domain-containing protein [Massilia sp. CFBP 13721]